MVLGIWTGVRAYHPTQPLRGTEVVQALTSHWPEVWRSDGRLFELTWVNKGPAPPILYKSQLGAG